MANLLNFVNKALHTGDTLNFYAISGATKIGKDGKAIEVDSQVLEVAGKVNVAGTSYDLDVRIEIEDGNSSGICNVTANGSTYQGCHYTQEGKKLVISEVDNYEIRLYRGSGKMTWVRFTKLPARFGIKPA